jgi:hypothetical protein
MLSASKSLRFRLKRSGPAAYSRIHESNWQSEANAVFGTRINFLFTISSRPRFARCFRTDRARPWLQDGQDQHR